MLTTSNDLCIDCLKRKQCAKTPPAIFRKPHAVSELLHLDLHEKPVESCSGKRYRFTVVDTCHALTWEMPFTQNRMWAMFYKELLWHWNAKPLSQSKLFGSKSRAALYLSPAFDLNGYRLYDPIAKIIVVTSSALFDDYSFGPKLLIRRYANECSILKYFLVTKSGTSHLPFHNRNCRVHLHNHYQMKNLRYRLWINQPHLHLYHQDHLISPNGNNYLDNQLLMSKHLSDNSIISDIVTWWKRCCSIWSTWRATCAIRQFNPNSNHDWNPTRPKSCSIRSTYY